LEHLDSPAAHLLLLRCTKQREGNGWMMGSRYLLLTDISGRYTPKSDWPVYAEIGSPKPD
jgi:hypothetical protein